MNGNTSRPENERPPQSTLLHLIVLAIGVECLYLASAKYLERLVAPRVPLENTMAKAKTCACCREKKEGPNTLIAIGPPDKQALVCPYCDHSELIAMAQKTNPPSS